MASAYKIKELNAFTLIHYNAFIYLHTKLLYYTAYSVFCYNVRFLRPHGTLPKREYLFCSPRHLRLADAPQDVKRQYAAKNMPYYIWPFVYPYVYQVDHTRLPKVIKVVKQVSHSLFPRS
jgi:hypothetical protein